jgi:hypothetical protein
MFDNEASFLGKKTGIKERTIVTAIRNNIKPKQHKATNDQGHNLLK